MKRTSIIVKESEAEQMFYRESANPNYWTIDEENINNREREGYSYRTCSAFDMGTKAEWMFYRYFYATKPKNGIEAIWYL